MRPEKLRHLLSQYGKLDRIYLKAEDNEGRKRRANAGGNNKKKYTEGWVEFHNKKLAKQVAMSLNGKNIGGKKSSYYHDDIWCMKYLSKFKWTNLTERVAHDSSVRKERLQLEMNQVRRETDLFMEQVEKSKGFASMEDRHSKKRKATSAETSTGLVEVTPKSRVDRLVRQRAPIA